MHSLLDAEEKAKAARFRHARDGQRYQAAHALTRLMLTAAVGGAVRPERWRFGTGPAGKPHAAGGPHFSLSHCDGLVACAVSAVVEVGLDVERAGPDPPLDAAAAAFSPAERRWLAGLPEGRQVLGFYRLWTLHEAYAKATGLGIGVARTGTAFHQDPPAAGGPAPWRFRSWPCGGAHQGALAWRSAMDIPVVSAEMAFAMSGPDLAIRPFAAGGA